MAYYTRVKNKKFYSRFADGKHHEAIPVQRTGTTVEARRYVRVTYRPFMEAGELKRPSPVLMWSAYGARQAEY